MTPEFSNFMLNYTPVSYLRMHTCSIPKNADHGTILLMFQESILGWTSQDFEPKIATDSNICLLSFHSQPHNINFKDQKVYQKEILKIFT